MLEFQNPAIFRSVLDTLHTRVYLVDREGTIVFWNDGAERITGHLREDVVGRYSRDKILVHDGECESGLCSVLCPLARAACDGEMREAAVEMRHRAGHRIPVWLRAIWPSKSGGARCLVTSVQPSRRPSSIARIPAPHSQQTLPLRKRGTRTRDPMSTTRPIIIIKKKGGHGGHHGGAWKVAYGDFVTAMMALFIVLWLMSTSNNVKQVHRGLFQGSPGFFQNGRHRPGGYRPELLAFRKAI